MSKQGTDKSSTKKQHQRERVPNSPGVYYRESFIKTHSGKPDRCFDICYRDQHEKLIWEKVGWTSEGYSAKFAAHLRGERLRTVRHGEELPKQKKKEVTFGEVWEKYDQWLETGKTRPSDDRGNYRHNIQDRFADKRLSQITPLELELLKTDLTKQGLAPATVKHVLVLIRQVINKAISWEMWHGENPVKKIKLPQLNNRRERFLTKEEADNVLHAVRASSEQLYEMALLSLHTGMRAGELYSLRWGDIDYANGTIHLADPKSGRSQKAYMTASVKTLLASKKPGDREELIFKSSTGEKLKEISNTFSRIVDKLELNKGVTDRRQKVTFHTLRHTFASWLARKGTPILVIKELMRHQSLAMTERYAHLAPDTKKQAIKGIEEIFNGAKEEGGSEEKQTGQSQKEAAHQTGKKRKSPNK